MVHDVVGVGFGPANLALSIALTEADQDLSAVFLEAQAEPGWHSHMMLPGSDIQHHPVRDLVSLHNPRSRYTFINFLHENDRLLKFLNLPAAFPLRSEYVRYIDWVRQNLPADVRYGQRVETIRRSRRLCGGYDLECSDGSVLTARALSLGPGRTPRIPDPFVGLLGSRVFHLSKYLGSLEKALPRLPAQAAPRIAIVGGSQSAVEVCLDLLERVPRARIDVVTRAWSLRAKDHSPFSEEIYFPAFTEYYYNASIPRRRRLDEFTRPTNYSAADLDVLERLYLRMYEDEANGSPRVRIIGDSSVLAAHQSGDVVSCELRNETTGQVQSLVSDLVILATGFKDMGKGANNEPHHPLLSGVADSFELDADGCLFVNSDYSLQPKDPACGPIFLNGLCESTHGIGDAGSFSLLSLRAHVVSQSLLQNKHAQPEPLRSLHA